MTLDAALDLFLGGSCAGCGSPGRILCRACRSALPDGARPVTPSRVGPVPVTASSAYAGLVAAVIVDHKERRHLGHRGVLGRLLARAVVAAAHEAGGAGTARPWVLVPVPSAGRTTRARGFDAAFEIARVAARVLRRQGRDVTVLRALSVRASVADQSGLSRPGREQNMAGAMWLRRRPRTPDGALVIVADDIVTTGATAREAVRVLTVAGVTVGAVACVAATPRNLQRIHGG